MIKKKSRSKYITLKQFIKKGDGHEGCLSYKGIKFDDVVADLAVWTYICPHCLKKYNKQFKGLAVDKYGGGGICGVKGCKNGGEDNDIDTYYLDFCDMPEEE